MAPHGTREPGLTLEEIINFLLETPLFQELEPDGLADVVGIMQIQRLRQGQPVFRQGDIGDAWYVIYVGSCQVTREGSFGRTLHVADLGPRACFGEMAVLDGSPRSATVEATSDLTLLRFPRAAYQELLAEGNLAAYQLVLGMARLLSERQRRLTNEVHGLLEQAEEGPEELHARMRNLVDAYRVSE